jgi:hypothetical protein
LSVITTIEKLFLSHTQKAFRYPENIWPFDRRRMSLLRAALAGLLTLIALGQAHTDHTLLTSAIEAEDAMEELDLEELLQKRETKNLRRLDDPNAFNIDLGFVGKITGPQRQGFLDAQAKWQSIITRDNAATACVRAGQAACGYRFKKYTCIDDIFIAVRIKRIDGVGRM